MSKAIAGAMNAPGLVDFTNDGLQDLTSAATDKFSKDSDDLDTKIQTYTDAFKTISDLPNSCTENDDAPGDSGGITVASNSSTNCSKVRNACAGKISSDGSSSTTVADVSWVNNLISLFSSTKSVDETNQDVINMRHLDSDSDDCKALIDSCNEALNEIGKPRTNQANPGGGSLTNGANG